MAETHGGAQVWRCPKCRNDDWCLATEDDRVGHRLPPPDGDMWTENDWCEGVAEVVAIEYPLPIAEARQRVIEAAYDAVTELHHATGVMGGFAEEFEARLDALDALERAEGAS